MFGIRVDSEFLDLGQNRFSINLKSPLQFDSSDTDTIAGSLLISTKAPLSKRNIRILQKAHVLTNPEPFLNQKKVEIFAEGSAIFRGLLSVTEATDRDISITVHINSPAALKDFTLKEIDFKPITGFARIPCNESITNFDTLPFACPTIYAPFQNGGEEVKNFAESSIQNLYRFGELYYDSVGATVTPQVKMTEILRGAFAKCGLKLNNHFADSVELRQLLLYYNHPLFAPSGWRHDDVLLSRHVPKIAANELTKSFLRFFNQGLFVDTFENQATISNAETVLEQNEILDWTKYVRKKYTIREKNRAIGKISMQLPDFLSDMFSTKQLELEATPDVLIEALYKQVDGSFLLKKNISFGETVPLSVATNGQPAATPTQWAAYRRRLMIQSILAEFKYSKTLSLTPNTNEFDLKATTLPQCRVRWEDRGLPENLFRFRVRGYYPATKSVDIAKNETEYKPTFLFYRGLDSTGPVASSEATRMFDDDHDTREPLPPADVKIGNYLGGGTDTRPSANYALQIDGEQGVFNRFFKRWAYFLQGAKEVDFELGLPVRELRKFSFEKTLFIGNKSYLAKELNIELSDKGIESVKATMIPFAA